MAASLLLPDLPPTDLVASGLFLRRSDRPLWLLLRATKHGEWGFPKGHVDPGENLIRTALRECAEETGIALVALIGPPLVDTYRVPSGKTKATVYYPAVTATTTVELSDEHDRYEWVGAAAALKLLSHPHLRALFQKALRTIPC
jgi:8-oxo-dGTP diphosphatase